MRFTRQIMQIAGLFLLAATSAFAQLQSGALLTISGGSPAVNRAVYDSQIHSGTVQGDPCDMHSSFVTDAYVLQGGSPTGCDNGDDYEITANNSSPKHQSQGTATISGTGYSFTITTFYLCGSSCTDVSLSTPPGFTPPMIGVVDGEPMGPFCNTNNTICTSPDTGFLAVTNNGPNPFTGTMTLAGTSGEVAYSDTLPSERVSGPLAVGQTWVFALTGDSSNNGGFTQSQTQPLTAEGTATFPFGPDEEGGLPGDDYILSGINNTGGETIQFDLFPTLRSLSSPGGTAGNIFNPGGNFPGYTCDPYGSLSDIFGEEFNDVCAEVHLTCYAINVDEEEPTTNGGDCTTFLYTLTADYTVPSHYGGAGDAFLLDSVGPNFASCPSSSWNQDAFSSVTVLQIKKKLTTNPGTACFVAANGAQVVNNVQEPAPLILEGKSFTAFKGLEFIFTALPPKLNFVPAGLSAPFFAPLNFDDIHPDFTANNFHPEALPISCSTRLPLLEPLVPLSGQLVNLTQAFPKLFPVENGFTEYLFKWNTAKNATGCVMIVFNIDRGSTILVPEEFEYFSF